MRLYKAILYGKLAQSRASTSKGNNHQEMVVVKEILQKTEDGPLKNNETQLQKSPPRDQTSNELRDGNPNHKTKTTKHQQKCRKTPEIQHTKKQKGLNTKLLNVVCKLYFLRHEF